MSGAISVPMTFTFLLTALAQMIRGGNVFTSVCLSTGGGTSLPGPVQGDTSFQLYIPSLPSLLCTGCVPKAFTQVHSLVLGDC